jgi:hypothetical protein
LIGLGCRRNRRPEDSPVTAKKPTAAVPISRDIDEVLSELNMWRRARKPGSCVPEAIWSRAVRLAGVHGAARIARVLRLDYYGLRRRLGSSVEQPPASDPAFVEFRASVAVPGCDCQVELERPDGSRMRIQLRSPSLPDLAALSQSFWRGAP